MPTPDESLLDSRLFRLISLAILLAVVATTLGLVRPTSLPLHHDTSRDLHGALTALNTDEGPLVGPPTSASGIAQGGFWTVHLATVLGLGGTMDSVALITFGLAVLALIALALAGSTLWEWEVGLAAALVAACVLVTARATWVVQWNPSLLPLPAALTLLFVLESVRHQRLLPLALAAATLGLTLQLHPASWILLPLVAWTAWNHVGRCRTGPLRARLLRWGLLATLALLPFALFGAEALYQTLLQAGQAGASVPGEGHHPTAWWCGVALGAAALHAFATIFRPAYARALHYSVALWAALPAALFLLFFAWRGIQPAPRHLLPYLPAAALVIGAIPTNIKGLHPLLNSWNWLRAVAPLTALGVLIALVATAHPVGVTYTYAEAKWIAEELKEEGICQPETVAASLHGAHAWALHGAVVAYLIGASDLRPCFQRLPAPRMVLRLPNDQRTALPEGWKVKKSGGSKLALIELPGILDWSDFRWRDVDDQDFHTASLLQDVARTAPGYPAWRGLQRTGRPGCVTLQVNTSVPPESTATIVPLLQAPLGGNRAEVVAAKGLDIVEQGRQFIRVRRQASGAPGSVELSWCTDHPLPQEVIRGLPPVAVALDRDGVLLLDALRKLEVVQ
jgi:hypothetical protein